MPSLDVLFQIPLQIALIVALHAAEYFLLHVCRLNVEFGTRLMGEQASAESARPGISLQEIKDTIGKLCQTSFFDTGHKGFPPNEEPYLATTCMQHTT